MKPLSIYIFDIGFYLTKTLLNKVGNKSFVPN